MSQGEMYDSPGAGGPPPGPGPGGPGYGPGGPGYGGFGRGGWGRGGFGPPRRHSGPIETKPFAMTSEFWLLVIAIIALLITTLTDNSIDSPFFWRWAIILLTGYIVSRGLAKSGTKSRAWDPREDLEPGRGGGEHRH